MENSNPLLRSIAVLLVGALIGWQGNAYFSSTRAASTELAATTPTESLDMNEFWDVWKTMQDQYVNVDKLDNQKQVYGAIAGLVNSLEDPYSVFMTPQENEEFSSSLNGDLEGIGAELFVDNGRLVVVSPLKDSPAEKAGLLSGDYIGMVDDQLTSEMSLWEAIMAIRGAKDTQVKLTVLREGTPDPIEITITRQEIKVPSIEIKTVEKDGKKFAHLSIYQFGDDTYKEFEEALRTVLLESPDGLILDLRMNGGGYLDSSIQIMSEFFKEQVTGVIVKKRNDVSEVTKTTGGGQLADIPMVVLIDEGSASASEILAGALQDYKRGTLIGVQSFGKGSVQELNDLSDGSTLRLTIAKWYTPNDHSIDHTGITPDIEVKKADDFKIDTETDNQLNAAVDYLLAN